MDYAASALSPRERYKVLTSFIQRRTFQLLQRIL
jgi:hypothetical protein